MNHRRTVFQFLLMFAASLLSTIPTFAQNLTVALPAGATRGRATTVTCSGQGLATAKTLWTTFPATVALDPKIKPTDAQATFVVTLPADAPLGIFGVRVITEYGISPVKLFVVDDLPIITKAANCQTIETAQKVAIPTAISGVMGGEQRDHFAINVQANQRVSIEVLGNRLGTDFDPMVRILKRNGQQVFAHDNDQGLLFDCRFDYVFKEAGEYIVELKDTRFSGGGDWAYVLRMGDFPVSRVAYPSGAKRGQPMKVELPAANGPAVNATAPAANGPFDKFVTITGKGGNASTWVPMIVDDREQSIETEPNDQVGQANGFELPRTVHGRVQRAGDVDHFKFNAKKGQACVFKWSTARLSSPAELYVRILDAKGAQLAAAEHAGKLDGELAFAPAADGSFILAVEDLNRAGGPEYVYRVEATIAPTEFTVLPQADRLVIPQGASIPITALLTRAGYAGPVELGIQSTNPKLTGKSEPAVAGAATGVLVVSAAPDAPVGWTTIQFVGAGTVGAAKLVRAGDLSGFLSPKMANLPILPSTVARDVAVLVTPKPFVRLTAKVDHAAVGRFVKTPLTVSVARDKPFDDVVTLAVESVPPPLQIAPKPIAKGQTAVQLEIVSPAGTPIGKFPLFISGTATLAGRPVQVYADVLYLNVKPAFALTIAAAETKIERKGKTSLVVKADRLPSYTGPIDLTLLNLPKGVTAPAIKIADKQNMATIELTAAPDAALGSIANLVAQGKAAIGGQPEAVDSPPTKLTVGGK